MIKTKFKYEIKVTLTEVHLAVLVGFLYQFLIVILLSLATNVKEGVIQDFEFAQEENVDLDVKNTLLKKTIRISLKSSVREVNLGAKPKNTENAVGVAYQNLVSNFSKKSMAKKLTPDSNNNKEELRQEGKDPSMLLENTYNRNANKAKSLEAPSLAFQLEDNVAADSTHSPDVEKINQVLASADGRFQRCYDSTLLLDENLNGRVDFFFTLNTVGSIDSKKLEFRGSGLANGRDTLINCLENVLQVLNFPTGTNGQQVKFSVLFRS